LAQGHWLGWDFAGLRNSSSADLEWATWKYFNEHSIKTSRRKIFLKTLPDPKQRRQPPRKYILQCIVVFFPHVIIWEKRGGRRLVPNNKRKRKKAYRYMDNCEI